MGRAPNRPVSVCARLLTLYLLSWGADLHREAVLPEAGDARV